MISVLIPVAKCFGRLCASWQVRSGRHFKPVLMGFFKGNSLFAVIIFLAYANPASLWPCGPGEPDPLRVFRPLQITSALYPERVNDRYLAALDMLAGTCEAPGDATKSDPNIAQWKDYFKKELKLDVSEQELSQLVYKEEAQRIQAALKGSAGNPVATRISKAGGRPALEYLMFAKEVEPLAVHEGGYWEVRENVSADRANPFIDRALKEAKGQKGALQARYFFQALRLAHYSGQYQRVEKIWAEASRQLKEDAPLFSRMLHLHAGALLRQEKTGEGLLALVRMAEKDPLNLQRVSLDFNRYFQKQDAFARAYASASDREKIHLLALQFFSDPAPGLDIIRKSMKLAPRDASLDYMLLREMDRLEGRLEDSIYYDRTASRRVQDRNSAFRDNPASPDSPSSRDSHASRAEVRTAGGDDFFLFVWMDRLWSWFFPSLHAEPIAKIPAEEQKYMQELARFIAESVDNDRVASPGAWKLAEAYILMLLGQHADAEKALSHTSVRNGNSPFVSLQRKRIALLNLSLSRKSPDSELEKAILADYGSVSPTHESMYYPCRWSDHAARLMLHENMVRLYSSQNKEGLALLWEPHASQIYSGMPVNVYSLDSLSAAAKLLNSPSGEYERMLKKISGLSHETVLARLGSRHMKSGNYDAAVQALEKVSAQNLNKMYYSDRIEAGPFQNPFSESFPSSSSKEDFNALSIARNLQSLQRQSSSSDREKAARAFYRLGLAQFNMSHFGHWWSAVDTDWSIYYEYSEKSGDPQLKLASGYFQKALEKSTDREIHAASRFMLATIAYLDATEADYFGNSEYTLVPDQKVQFDKLAELEDTEFYKEVIRSCTYYMNYRN